MEVLIICISFLQAVFLQHMLNLNIDTKHVISAYLAKVLIFLCFSGYLVSFFTLFFVTICEIGLDVFDSNTSYSINLIAVAIVAYGCTGKRPTLKCLCILNRVSTDYINVLHMNRCVKDSQI